MKNLSLEAVRGYVRILLTSGERDPNYRNRIMPSKARGITNKE
jgi:hypothetical protein